MATEPDSRGQHRCRDLRKVREKDLSICSLRERTIANKKNQCGVSNRDKNKGGGTRERELQLAKRGRSPRTKKSTYQGTGR